MLFLANKLSKMKQGTKLGSRIAEVHNGSSLFTGSAGQGESNIRRWIIENDWLEAIVALPLNMFYNTGIATYVWVLTNRKPEHRKGKVQLIDATRWFRPLRKNLGKKNCRARAGGHREDLQDVPRLWGERTTSKIFENEAFGYWKVTVEQTFEAGSGSVGGAAGLSSSMCVSRRRRSHWGMPCMRWGAGWVLGRISTSIGSWTR